jgi:tRNA pseudouridine38-40 synthase
MTDERTYRMVLQYDGTGLHGWAKQEGLLTVEGCLEEALRTALGHAPLLRVAGRTDAGVHARRQVVSLRLPLRVDCRRLLASLNALTPPAIAVARLAAAPDGFDARRDALARTYRYHLFVAGGLSPFWKPYCWWVPAQLDLAAMREAAALLVGQHDFTAFTPTETEHVHFRRQVLECSWKRQRGGLLPRSGLLVFEIEAQAFLRRMVRVLVGTMVEVGQGKRTVEEFGRLLQGANRDEAGQTAPARGLFLWDIRY